MTVLARLLSVPHRIDADVVEVTGQEPMVEFEDGSMVPPGGATLAQLRQRLGGDEGEFPVPGTDRHVRLSLARWTGAPPDKLFQVRIRITPERPIRIRRPAAEWLIPDLPARESQAVTLDELLDRPVQRVGERRLPDGGFAEESFVETPRDELARWARPPSRATLVRGLGRLAAAGRLRRSGSGRPQDPYRYWDPSRLLPGSPKPVR